MTDQPWHRRDPEDYRRVARAIDREFPGLHFEERDRRLLLAGEFQVAEGGRVLALYQIEVEVPSGGPRTGIPVVREVGGRIPCTPERHVNGDGTACIGVADELWYRHPEGMDLLDFLRGPVLGYFVGQAAVEQGGTWPYGERGHGPFGVIEFYASLFGTSDPMRVHALLTMAGARKVRAHWRCPCGSGRRVAACHDSALRELRRRVPRHVIRTTAASLEPFVPYLTPR